MDQGAPRMEGAHSDPLVPGVGLRRREWSAARDVSPADIRYCTTCTVYCSVVYRKAMVLPRRSPGRKGHIVVRLKISELMARRGITAYALSKGSHLSYPSAYRLSRAGGLFGRLHTDTLDTLCEFFQVQPGTLLEWVPAKAKKN
jgi:DNA-binding Xre family transcriptional regulator